MQYRQFNDGSKVSLLGVGTMRLPCNADGSINRPEAISMIRTAVDKGGVNYVDTAYMYHGGDSERLVGEALQDGYREKVLLADKMPVVMVRSPEQAREIFAEQLDRLQTDYIDYYLAHNITKKIWEIGKKHDVIPYLQELKEQGKIKRLGFSYHDDLEFFKEVVDAAPWDFCQIQFNFMDKNYQAGIEGLKYAASKGLSVIIMEPLKGGKLTEKVPAEIQAIWDSAEVKRTPAEWGLRWVANFPEVTCILSGMSSMEQLLQNIETMEDALPGTLTEAEMAVIDKVSDKYNETIKYSCTGCQYCLPCAKKIPIPDVIECYNEWHAYGDNAGTRLSYSWIPAGKTASASIDCKACEGKCPQHLPISQIMKEAAQAFGK